MELFIIVVLGVLTAFGILAVGRALLEALRCAPTDSRERLVNKRARALLRKRQWKDIYKARFREVYTHEPASRNELTAFVIELGNYLDGLGVPANWPAGAEDRLSQDLKNYKAERGAQPFAEIFRDMKRGT